MIKSTINIARNKISNNFSPWLVHSNILISLVLKTADLNDITKKYREYHSIEAI